MNKGLTIYKFLMNIIPSHIELSESNFCQFMHTPFVKLNSLLLYIITVVNLTRYNTLYFNLTGIIHLCSNKYLHGSKLTCAEVNVA